MFGEFFRHRFRDLVLAGTGALTKVSKTDRAWQLHRRALYKRGEIRTRIGGLTGRFHFRDRYDELRLIGDYSEREQLVEFVRLLQPCDTVCEVGGAIGAWTVFMGQRVADGHVHVFEPEPASHKRLTENIALNELRNVTIHSVAASSSNGVARFGVARPERGGSHSLILGDVHQQVIEVPTLRLDDAAERLGMTAPTAVKIDCEGAECEVLAGMSRILGSGVVRVIYLELHPPELERVGHTPEEVVSTLEDAGYGIVKRWNRTGEILVIFQRRR